MPRKSSYLIAKKKEQESCLSMRQIVECICPLCGLAHKQRLFWTGSIPARVYCEACNRKVNR